MIIIKKKIILKLFQNNQKILHEECEAKIDNNVLEYKDSTNISCKIYLDKKVLIRESKEFKLEIDFNQKVFSYFLKENDYNVKSEINCEFIYDDDLILSYELDKDSNIKIIIHILEQL